MTDASQVLLIVPDHGLRRSLEFALEVEGFAVVAYENVAAALVSTGVAEGTCIVIDEDAVFRYPFAITALRHFRQPILLLVDGPEPASKAPGVRILRKPLLGNALIKAVRFAGKSTSK